MAIKRIELLSVPVSDQDRASAFYVDVLGFEVLVDSPFGDGLRWIQLGLPGTQTSISLTTWFEDFPPGILRGLILEVDDLDATRAELEAKGVRFGDEMSAEWGRFLGFADPDGNRWSLRQPPH